MNFYDEDLTHDEFAAALQERINDGSIWRLEGSAGRMAMEMIQSGDCILGETGHHDFWGGYIPSRYEVRPGTAGSIEYAEEMQS